MADDETTQPEAAGVREIAGAEWTVLIAETPAPYSITGQFMFYAPDRDRLLEIARGEIAAHGFHEARVSVQASPAGYVLCLYAADEARKQELGRRVAAGGGGITYLYWKTGTAVPRVARPADEAAPRARQLLERLRLADGDRGDR